MKKRIACILMTLIMLVSLVPAAALTASAASMSTSEAAITVLKKMTQFHDTCYQVANTQEFRIGYGTVCNGADHNIGADGKVIDGKTTVYHTIGQTDADEALRAALQEMDKKVNSFASSNGLTLSQNQHDALVLFSFNSGTAWMDGNGVVKTAIVNGAGTNELLNAMNLWTNNANPGRRKIEVNMYVNDVYSNVVPTSYVSVTYDANGGTMAQGDTYTMLFDKTVTVSHTPTPTKSNSTFLGWYIGGEVWAPNLTSDCSGKTLKALWQPKGQVAAADAGAEVKYSLNKTQLASTTIYNWPNLKAESCKSVGTVSTTKVSVIRDYIGTDGTRWAKIGTDKWVIVKAGSNGISSGGTDVDVTVTVTNSYVNSRVNASIFSATNGSYEQGAELRIISTAQADGFLWGQVAKSQDDDTPICWVALMYTNWNSVKDQQNAADSSENTEAIAKATVTATGYLNVRSDAGTDNKIVGALAKNETVDVYEIKTVNGHQWGRTNSGWFCMTYTSVTMLGDNGNKIISDEGALAYAFTGKTTMELKPHVQPGTATNTTGDTLKASTSVTLTNMVVTGTEGTWGKIVWRVDTNKDGKLDSNKTGWVPITELSNAATASPIKMDAARFQVVSDTKVRKASDNSADSLFTITKGVEFEAVEIRLVGENIWGLTSEIEFVDDSDTLSGDGYNGWVNLSNKYVTRMNAPTIEDNEADPSTDLMAKVINTDSVNVRNYGSTTSGKVIGTLARDTIVRVWEINEDKDWYKIDTNKNGTYDYEEDGWVSAKYLEITKASAGSSSDGSGSDNGSATRTTGTGIVANTYAGVNVRSGAGIGNPAVGKLLPGTVVNILETKTAGNATWGRVSQGWVCMDYITMISYDEIPNGSTGNSGNGTAVDDLDKVDKTTTTAVYTGKINTEVSSVNVYAAPALESDKLDEKEVVRVLKAGDPITMYELLTVKETYEKTDTDEKDNESDPDDKAGGGTTTTVTVTSYWARVNDGYIYNPEANITLDALDEAVHTLTGSDTLNVRKSAGTDSAAIDKLEKGDQVQVTSLQIDNDKVWGRIETANDGYGWIRLDYMSEGAYYVQEATAAATPTTPAPTIGSTGNTGTGGFVNNSSGYKYTGTVIRNGATTLKVHTTPSTSSTVTAELNTGASLVIYETTIADGMAWGRCDAGWVYLYYVDLTPSSGSAVDAKIVYTENAIVYTDSNRSDVAGTYARMSLVDIYEVVYGMARTDLGWVSVDDIG